MLAFRRTQIMALLIALIALLGARPLLPQTLAAAAPKAAAAGAASVNMSCGEVYSQQWDSCVGVFTYSNGNVYRGEFHHGLRDGLGMIFIQARGISNEGTIMSPEPGTIYAGEFRDDRINGHGLWITPRAVYSGTFVSNIPQRDVVRRDCVGDSSTWTQCLARVPYTNGNVYTGEFMRGVREGLGLLEINDRGVSDAGAVRSLGKAFYVGLFKNDHLNGHGMTTMQDGSGSVGIYADNVLTAPSRPSVPGVAAPPGPQRDPADALVHAMSDPLVQRQTISTAATTPVMRYNPCANARFTLDKTAIPYKPLSVDDSGRIISGAWKVVVAEEGCGSQRQLNVLVSADRLGRLSMTPLLPGNTYADAAQQSAAIRYASLAVGAVPGAREPSCNISYVADTQFVAEDTGGPQPGARSSPWRERWTLATCTLQLIVPMRFIPDSTGITIAPGSSKDIKVLPLAKGKEVQWLPEHMTPALRAAG